MNSLTTSHVRFDTHELPQDFFGPRFQVVEIRSVHGLPDGRVGQFAIEVGVRQRTAEAAARLIARAPRLLDL